VSADESLAKYVELRNNIIAACSPLLAAWATVITERLGLHIRSDERLYGAPGDEHLDADMLSTVERLWDQHPDAGPGVEVDGVRVREVRRSMVSWPERQLPPFSECGPDQIVVEPLAGGDRRIVDLATVTYVPTTLTVTVEEWSVAAPDAGLPTASDVGEWIAEHAATGFTEEAYEGLCDTCGSDEVQAAIQVVLGLIAAKQTWKMAGELLATHTVEVTTTSPIDFDWRIVATDGKAVGL
jgi:hypothetical protein